MKSHERNDAANCNERRPPCRAAPPFYRRSIFLKCAVVTPPQKNQAHSTHNKPQPIHFQGATTHANQIPQTAKVQQQTRCEKPRLKTYTGPRTYAGPETMAAQAQHSIPEVVYLGYAITSLHTTIASAWNEKVCTSVFSITRHDSQNREYEVAKWDSTRLDPCSCRHVNP